MRIRESPDNKSVHTESRVARHFEIKVVRRDPVTSSDIHLMRVARIIATTPLILLMVGCHDADVVKKLPSIAEASANDSSVAGIRLSEIGEPDAIEQEIDDILIIGSALTDDHVAAIRLLTDAFEPTKPNRYLIRNIQHTGPNAATNIWQTGHAQFYQTLVLRNGVWEIDEEGGGFGHR